MAVDLEKEVEQIRGILSQAIREHVFPGTVVGYIIDGEVRMVCAGKLAYGQSSPAVTIETCYDLASITKSVPVATLALWAIEQGKLDLDDNISQFVDELPQSIASEIRIIHLLTNTVALNLPSRLSYIVKQGGDVLSEIFAASLAFTPGSQYKYSNVPSILLGLVVERVIGKRLDIAAQDIFFGPLGMKRTGFVSPMMPTMVAPSEVDWRGRRHGLVHDETAWSLQQRGMLAGCAGMFSCAPDLLRFCQMLLNRGRLEGDRYLSSATIQAMHTAQQSHTGECIGLGWELNQPYCMGTKTSKQCFGATGFTGTMILIDPVKDRALVFLSNRLYPVRPADSRAINAVRNRLAEIVFA